MKLTVNGEAYDAKRPESVTALLEEMGIGGRPVVVVLNDEVIPTSSRSTRGLREGDCVELFRLVGGGCSAGGGRHEAGIRRGSHGASRQGTG